ncbi:helix-turn-helix transcriptional regulator [uncultured Lactobacillus sp.]|uniref:helix-turn-helix domain-containing protein n=1 Tax=uncultured Lactobacillus sp. TaxID=153152 RepID=UPI002805D310|nr:helix-turn-helix transcriptional regulator [uncultured Lactobacillus sp.]
MTIGQALKSLRLHAGLTQEEMAAGIMSVSFYSKVERDIHEIDTNTLIKLLAVHRFDAISFFTQVVNQDKNIGNPYYSIESEITFARNTKDLKKLDEINKRIKEEDSIPNWLRFRVELAYAWVTHSNKYISPELKKKVRNGEILPTDNWDRRSYYFLSQAVIFMDIKEAYEQVNLAYAAFKKHPATDPFSLQFVSWIAVNFLNCCYHQKADVKYTKSSIEFLRSLPITPEIGFSAVLGTYYEALFNHDQKVVDAVILVLKKSKFYGLIEDTVGK